MSGIVMAGVGMGANLITGLFAGGSAKRAARAAAAKAATLERKINKLEGERPVIINPYANFKDLSSTLSNPYANLGVATQATDIQIEEADISLANTLDTIRSTGASAGGATALAQAALQSKKGVAASIEAQEANNQKLLAQGKESLDAKKIAEAQRMQQADAAGQEFMYREEDSRKMQQIQRAAGQQDQAYANQAQQNQNAASSYGSMISGIGSIASSYISANPAANPAATTTDGPK